MKFFFILFSIFFVANCSLNKDSKYWKNDNQNRLSDKAINTDNNKDLSKILNKSGDLNSMTIQEYELFIKDYTKKNEFPDISK